MKIRRFPRRSLALALSLLLFLPTLVLAQAVPEKVTLEPLPARDRAKIEFVVDGKIVEMSRAEAEATGLYRAEITGMQWPQDDGVYEGPLLSAVLAEVGLGEVAAIKLRAADDYSVEIPREDWDKWPVLLATRRAGKPLKRRDRGPFRILYPQNMDAAMAKETLWNRWIFMVVHIEEAK